MNKEFCTYEQALALKELGFDEPCLAFWDGKNTDAFYFNNIRDASGDYTPFQKHDRLKWFGAPLYQQAFRWFREKHGMHHGIGFIGLWYYDIQSLKDTENAVYEVAHKWDISTYEEAEQACLDKLIEICKNK